VEIAHRACTQALRYVHPNMPLISDEAAEGWGAHVVVISELASGRKNVWKWFQNFWRCFE
jgi:hypothetical protein